MMRHKRTKPKEGQHRYSVGGLITISMHTKVIASTPEEAREIARQRGILSLCYQCSYGEPEEEWVTSGELDSYEVSPYDGDDELDVVELEV